MKDHGQDVAKNLAAYFGKELNNVQLTFYGEYFNQFTLEQVNKVFRGAIRTFAKFPTIAELCKLFDAPKEDERDAANEMAGAIISSIREFGYNRAKEVEAHVGPVAWHAIEQFGGWENLCSTESDNLPTIRAQLRDLCKSVMAMKDKRGGDILKLPYEYQRKGMKKLMDAIDNSFVDVYKDKVLNSGNEYQKTLSE